MALYPKKTKAFNNVTNKTNQIVKSKYRLSQKNINNDGNSDKAKTVGIKSTTINNNSKKKKENDKDAKEAMLRNHISNFYQLKSKTLSKYIEENNLKDH